MPLRAGLISKTNVVFAAICAIVVVVGFWNVARYPPGNGYDAVDHMAYADGLFAGEGLPDGVGEYYTPPGYYTLVGAVDWVAEQVGLGDPHRAGMAVNVLLLLGTVLLVRMLALELFPGRDRLAVAAAAFVAFVPVTVKAEAMFHPEMLSLFLCTLALWLAARTFADARYAPALGVALGAAQLVRAFALWAVAATAIALFVGRRWREVAVVLVLAAAIPAPWYIHQRIEYGGSPVFNRPTTDAPLYERRPWRFYLDPGVPEVITRPYRTSFLNLALPTTYTETWGDYFGIWVWDGVGSPPESARDELRRQSVIGLLPTLLAIVGWLALLRTSFRRPVRLAVALMPALGILGYLYFTVSYPTPDGDVLKGTYMLTTAAAWALGFGYALDRFRGRLFYVLVGLLAIGALAQIPFLVYD
jgi:hypothetical protein